jgi:hypothetical protein
MNEHASNITLPRFWVTASGPTTLDDGGFLHDPGWTLTETDQNTPHHLENQRDTPVLVLLGEAGMGKSTAILEEANAAGDPQPLDLGAIETPILRSRLDGYAARAAQGQATTLWLDSLDEARTVDGRIERILAEAIEHLPEAAVGNLRLRIVTRSLQDAESLFATLARRWDIPDGPPALALCPLRKRDARSAAERQGIDSEAFLEAVHGRDLEHLARRPKTLFHLIEVFRADGALPDNRWDLYEHALRLLMAESPSRQHVVRMDPDTRMRVAGRLAAVSMLSQCNRIRTGEVPDRHPEMPALHELAGPEPHPEHPQVTLPELRETVNVAGLFRHTPDATVGFDHRSDAEFLAARYLADSELTPTTIRGLIESPRDGLIPLQMTGLAGWLANAHEELRRWLIDAAPLESLKSELQLDDSERAKVVQHLLTDAHNHRILPLEPAAVLARADYPGLAAQLRPHLAIDGEDELAACLFAVRLLDATDKVHERLEELLNILSAESTARGLYCAVMDALSRLVTDADAERRGQVTSALERFAHLPPDTDDRVQLKGAALRALWPHHLDVDTLFQALNTPAEGVVYGSYDAFLQQLPETLERNHLPAALEWAKRQYERGPEQDIRTGRLLERIMRLSWEAFDDPDVQESFVGAAEVAFDGHVALFGREALPQSRSVAAPLDDVEKRRCLALALAQRIDSAARRAVVANQILRDEDAAWLLERIERGDTVCPRVRLADLLRSVFHWGLDRAVIDHALDVAGPHAEALGGELQGTLLRDKGCIALHGALADYLRRCYGRPSANPKPGAQKPIRKRLDDALDQWRSGGTHVWLQLLEALSGGEKPGSWMMAPMADLPGWSHCRDDEPAVIQAAAGSFLHEYSPSGCSGAQGNKRTVNYRDNAGIAAWELLICDGDWACAPRHRLPVWRTLLLELMPLTVPDKARRRQIMHYLVDFDADGFVSDVRAVLRRAAQSGLSGEQLLAELPDVWSEGIATMLRRLAEDAALTPADSDAIRERLLEQGDEATAVSLRHAVENDTPPGDERAARLLLEFAPGEHWDVLGPFLDSCTDGGRSVIDPLLQHLGGRLGARLAAYPIAAAHLFTLIERLYPGEDEDVFAGGLMTAVDHAGYIKRELIRVLRQSEQQAGIEAITSLQRQFPEQAWLKPVAAEIHDNARAAAWAGTAPTDLVALLADAGRRLVQSDEQLLSVVEESLGRLQDRLSQSNPMARFLWLRDKGKELTHLSEDWISDFIQDHLEMDIVRRNTEIHREVQVRNLSEKGMGTRTDLRIDATGGPRGNETCTIIIEVKGDWHDELFNAMGKQLVERYLQAGITRCGLYLALWSGKETSQSNKASPQKLQHYLENQAERVSAPGSRVGTLVLDITVPTS